MIDDMVCAFGPSGAGTHITMAFSLTP